jgi:hypothetical protein
MKEEYDHAVGFPRVAVTNEQSEDHVPQAQKTLVSGCFNRKSSQLT